MVSTCLASEGCQKRSITRDIYILISIVQTFVQHEFRQKSSREGRVNESKPANRRRRRVTAEEAATARSKSDVEKKKTIKFVNKYEKVRDRVSVKTK